MRPSAARSWRNAKLCMCSVTIDAKGARIDKSACPVHGKALTIKPARVARLGESE